MHGGERAVLVGPEKLTGGREKGKRIVLHGGRWTSSRLASSTAAGLFVVALLSLVERWSEGVVALALLWLVPIEMLGDAERLLSSTTF